MRVEHERYRTLFALQIQPKSVLLRIAEHRFASHNDVRETKEILS
jgi:hypothetical protein